jgi:hypothetical protein
MPWLHHLRVCRPVERVDGPPAGWHVGRAAPSGKLLANLDEGVGERLHDGQRQAPQHGRVDRGPRVHAQLDRLQPPASA